jgi:hypothetical protein
MLVSYLTKENFSCVLYQKFTFIASDLGHQIFTDVVDYKQTIKNVVQVRLDKA